MKKTMLAAVLALLTLGIAPKYAHATYDGTPSTGSFTIATNSSLAAASATGTVTVVETTTLVGTQLTIAQYTFIAGRDFSIGTTTATAATSLKAAINASGAPVTAVYAAGDAAIALTAVSAGTLYNGTTLVTSASGEISVSGAHLTGGLNDAFVKINAVALVQGRDWFKQDVASNTAVNLAAAINLSPVLHTQVEAVWLGGASTVVFLRARLSPVAYTLATSGSPITTPHPTMVGGAAGTLARSLCFLGTVNALPTQDYPQGCLLYLNSAPTKLYLSTQAVTGAAAAAANSWLAIP
ncbi:MAG: hypothetical protein V4510_10010 [bacterium]